MMQDNDNSFPKSNEYLEHTRKYTVLLDNFIHNAESSSKLKNGLKIAFFVIIIFLMIFLTFLFTYSIYKAFDTIKYINTKNIKSIESVIGAVISIIPSLATMIVSLVKLPEIIAKYLFNLKEDKNMVAIIEKIQNYDVQMYSLENDVQNLLMKTQSKNRTIDKPTEEIQEKLQQPADNIDKV